MPQLNNRGACLAAVSINRDRRPLLQRTPVSAKQRSSVGVRVQALAENRAVIDIYGVIGDGQASAGDVLAGLRGIEADAIEIRINSDGGHAMDGVAIYNDLSSLVGKRDVLITGIAGSAASVIAMAGDTIRMMDGAEFFIHNPWIDCAGDARFHRQIADELDRTAAAMRRIYSARTDIPEDEIQALMDAEVLLTAQEALDLGFCDEIVPLRGRAFAQSRYEIVRERLSGKRLAQVEQSLRVAAARSNLSSERAAVAQLAHGLRELATQIRS